MAVPTCFSLNLAWRSEAESFLDAISLAVELLLASIYNTTFAGRHTSKVYLLLLNKVKSDP